MNLRLPRSSPLVIALFLVGCQPAPLPAPPPAQTVVRGPYQLTLTLTPPKAQVGDILRVTLQLAAPPGTQVTWPAAADFTDWTGVELAPSPTAALPTEPLQQTYTLPLLTSGQREIPALTVTATAATATADAIADAATQPADQTFTTQPQPIEIASALTDQDDTSTPRDITGVLGLPRHLNPWLVASIALAALVCLGLLLAAIRWARQRARRPAPPELPEAWALRELRALDPARVTDDHHARNFYYRLSEIVRVYIERQFHVAAPEMTTEEFLRMLVAGRLRLPYEPLRLQVFLEACDLVKYAAFAPQPDDADQARSTAIDFVESTALAVRSAARRAAEERAADQRAPERAA